MSINTCIYLYTYIQNHTKPSITLYERDTYQFKQCLPPSRPRSSLGLRFGRGLGLPTVPGERDAARKNMETCRSVDLRQNVCVCNCMHACMYV